MIQPTHIDFNFIGHRTLIRTLHKPWFIYFPFFWIKPFEIWYLGKGTEWYIVPGKLMPAVRGKKVTLMDSLRKCPRYISTQLNDLEKTQRIIKLTNKNTPKIKNRL